MMSTEKVSDVFLSSGQPHVTYIKRDSGSLELRLYNHLDEAGQICLITGPSKTGKTTLYKHVLEQRKQLSLVVQCTAEKTALGIWTEALGAVNFDRITELSNGKEHSHTIEAGVEGEGGVGWFAKLAASISTSKSSAKEEIVVRQRIIADASPDLLIPILKSTKYVLVIEDFHYLRDSEKVILLQQWKRFIDAGISIIVLSTSHRCADIISGNRDLTGRTSHLEVSSWDKSDLAKICEAGFSYLENPVSGQVTDFLAKESVGLPILTQQICLQLYRQFNIVKCSEARERRPNFSIHDAMQAFVEVAQERYSTFKAYYDALISGPREKTRKHKKTYELVVSCFSLDPIRFHLGRDELDERIRETAGSETPPPSASIRSTLAALQRFQQNRNFSILEWRATERKLYITEPSFLFYLRWRERSHARSSLIDAEAVLTLSKTATSRRSARGAEQSE